MPVETHIDSALTDGTCYLCGETCTGREMTRHLQACTDDHATATDGRTFHLGVSDVHRPDYWLHLGVAPERRSPNQTASSGASGWSAVAT